MKVGDLVRKRNSPSSGVGVVTHIHSDGYVDVALSSDTYTWVEAGVFISHEEVRRDELREEVITMLQDNDFESAISLYESDCSDWWERDDFLGEKGKIETRLLEEQRDSIRNKVLSLLGDADFEAAISLYESDCSDWWERDDFLDEKEEAQIELEEQRDSIRNKILSLLGDGGFEAAISLYESDCSDWWERDDFLGEKGRIEARIMEEQRQRNQKLELQSKEEEIRNFCKDYNLVEDEIFRLACMDQERAHKFTVHIIEKQKFAGTIISRDELSWAAQCGASQTVGQYVESSLFANIDDDRLKIPKENVSANYDQSFRILTLHDYEPKRGRSNFEVPDSTNRIIDFKNGVENVVQDYTDALDEVIAPNVIVCCPPSHAKDAWGEPLLTMLEKLGSTKGRSAHPRLLRRTRYTEKRTTAESNRTLSLNLETIEVTNKGAVSDRPVIVVDDVTTTGNTAAACAKLLWDSGCNCVGAIVLGQTIHKHHEVSVVQSVPPDWDAPNQGGGADLDDEIPF